LASIRGARDAARDKVAGGINTAVQKKITRHEMQEEAAQKPAAIEAARVTNLKIQDMFDAWTTDGVRRKDGNAMLLRMFNADVLPPLGAIAVMDTTEHHLRAVLRAMVDRGVNRSAVMMHANLVQMFAWARKRQPWRKLMVEGDPMDLIEIDRIVSPEYDIDNQPDRMLSPAAIVDLRDNLARQQAEYDAAPNERIVPQPVERHTQLGIWIMLPTMCRVGEMSMARWEHIDLAAGEWFIPKANDKDNLADLTVYLSEFSLQQFKQLHALTGGTEWCFPNRGATDHINLRAISKQVGDRQTMFKTNADGTPCAPMKNRRADNTLVLLGDGGGAWTPHDLRRTGATMMQKLGINLDVIDRCQNHVLPRSKVRRHYMHHDYADEKRAAWALGKKLEEDLGEAKMASYADR
jgi:integrase